MKKKQDKRAKLLVAIINKEDELRLTSSINKCCTAVHFSGIGHGTARSSYMSYFGFNEIEKRVVFSIIPGYLEHTVLTTIGQDLKLLSVTIGQDLLCRPQVLVLQGFQTFRCQTFNLLVAVA